VLQKRIDKPRVQRLKPGQDLRKIALQRAGETVQQARLIIDQLPPLLHEQLQGARRLIVGLPWSQLLPVLVEELLGKLRICGIIFGSTRREGCAKFRQGTRVHRVRDQKGILQEH
jgi:hypothetical protein